MKAQRLLMTASALVLAAFVGTVQAETAADAKLSAEPIADIVRAPGDLPGPLGARGPEHVVVNLDTVEVTGKLADGATYRYWTYNEKVPGPLIRVRVGDTVEVNLSNDEDSWFPHNIDLHAVTGPGGGGEATMTMPGDSSSFTFKALKPGLYVYHCATPMVADHIAAGMYGMILVEPEGGLPPVDREFYVMQGEIYTEQAFGTQGEHATDYDKLLNETPEYYVFNGSAYGLKDKTLQAEVGETIRIYFGVGGPNKTSSFHVIGEIFDNVYSLGSLNSEVVNDVQTVTVAPGGATAVDIELDVPGNYILVDHALSRVERGLAGILQVKGAEQPAIFGAIEAPVKTADAR
ncbi:copper-containing nitrite reductase [Citreimonas salinaria]|uniref:Copper-containing nitrite reductase n=1 Tax=Citreimonas salinaria TaxID=321339 RepID=A0A1H3MTY9_9RHOB|nr:copper-containing nitrite reductase [Citreimonas salinaria]SDY80141.1 nitrite reductase (NO-forming) [Citreimonas salinaria]